MKKTAICLAALLTALSLFGCGGNGEQVTTGAPAESSVRDTSEVVSSSEASEEIKKTETTGTSEAYTETVTEPAPVRSFGKIVSDYVALVNQRTLDNEGSGVFDVLGDLSSVSTADAVNAMIEAYSLPNKAYYGKDPVTDAVKQELIAETNLEALRETSSEDLVIRYGILTENADVRGFPTDLRATDTGAAEEYDFLQETKLCLGSGVIVLWTSKSGEYFFVQGYNYNGWIRATSVALCSEEEFREYLSPDDFLVCKFPDQSDPLKRMGEMLPVTKIDGSLYTYAVPVRNDDGTLRIEEVTAPWNELSEWYHEGFYDWSEETCVELMRSLIGFPYGWGDTNNAYDCSSTIGGVYQCFGFVLPRNTGIMKHFGVHSEDVEGKTYAELRDMIASHPSAILVFKGHALMSCGVRTGDDGSEYVSIVHNTKGWNVPEGDGLVYQYKWCVTDSCPEEMLKADGTMTLDYLTRIIWVE